MCVQSVLEAVGLAPRRQPTPQPIQRAPAPPTRAPAPQATPALRPELLQDESENRRKLVAATKKMREVSLARDPGKQTAAAVPTETAPRTPAGGINV